MSALLAHAGHWYHAILYLAPVLIVALVLWAQGRRERAAGGEGRERAPDERDGDDGS